MRTIILSIFLFTVTINGQTFSIIGDSLNYQSLTVFKASVQLKNNTNNEITIDSVYIRLLLKGLTLDEIRNTDLVFALISNDKPPAIITVFNFTKKVLRNDTSFFASTYQSNPLKIQPDSIITIGKFNAGIDTPWPGYTYVHSDIDKFALIIFKSGNTYDTVTVFGSFAPNTNIAIKPERSKQCFSPSPAETFNIRGQRVPPSSISNKNQLRIIKNGDAIKHGWLF